MSENENKNQNNQNPNKENKGGQGHRRNHHRHKSNKQNKPQNAEQAKPQENTPKPAPNQKKPQSNKHQRPNKQNHKPKNEASPSIYDLLPENDSIFGKVTPRSATKKETAKRADEVEMRQLSDEELFGTSHILYTPVLTDEPTVEVVGVRFKPNGKIYFFAPEQFKLKKGDFVIVDTARGIEFGEICFANRLIKEKDVVQPLHSVCRPATKEDIERNRLNKQKEKDSFKICLEKIANHGLDMKLVDVQCSFDNSKLLFYFTSAGRVDFRELVRDLASQFKTRIELRQIGIRDEAKLVGGIGICGRPLCCSRYLSNFAQVSIKMAKEQGLSLSSNKISGNCGRLMCCLNFENQTYVDEIKRTPMPGSKVKVSSSIGQVVDANPLTGMLKIKLEGAADNETVNMHRDDVVLLSKKVIEEDITETEE